MSNSEDNKKLEVATTSANQKAAKNTPKKQSAEELAFESLDKITSAGKGGSRLLDFFFGRWLRLPSSNDWVVDSELAKIQQSPIKSKALLYGMFLAVIGLGVWSYFAEIDEVVRGEGKVVPSSQLQKLQSLDGGVVQEILVTEGQIVEAGEVLLKVDPTRFISDFRSQQEEYFSVLGQVARLRALIGGLEPKFDDELEEKAPQVIKDEMEHYKTSLDELRQRNNVFRAQVVQRNQELAELRVAVKQYAESLALTKKEYDVTLPLRKSGAVSEVELLRLEREISILQGDRDKAQASIVRTIAAIDEAESRLEEVETSMRNEWRTQLSQSSARLRTLQASETGLADRVNQTEVRSSTRGVIQKLHINTVGGVVTPGRDVIDMVPLDDRLIVEAKVRPQDIAQLRAGQKAMIKFTAYDFMIYGGFFAEVQHISADTITDERDNTFYIVRLSTYVDSIPSSISIIPGMTAEVDVMTGKKTVMQYLMKPVLRATSMALTER